MRRPAGGPHRPGRREIADAQKVKGLAPLACKTDKIDSQVLAVLSQRDLVPAIWLIGETGEAAERSERVRWPVRARELVSRL